MADTESRQMIHQHRSLTDRMSMHFAARVVVVLAVAFPAAPVPSAHAKLLPNGILNDDETSINCDPDPSTVALLAIAVTALAMRRAVWRCRSFRLFVALVWLVGSASPVSAGQILLTSASVIGGSGAWNDQRWDSGPFAAGLVVDNQSAFLIDEPDQNSGDANGGFWLGREGDEEEFLVLDLGRQYVVGGIELFQTHDAALNDRSTNGYEIYGGTAVAPIDSPDEPQAGGMNLLDPVLVASGSLPRQTSKYDPIEPLPVKLQELSCIRYLRFNTVGPLHDGSIARSAAWGSTKSRSSVTQLLSKPATPTWTWNSTIWILSRYCRGGSTLRASPPHGAKAIGMAHLEVNREILPLATESSINLTLLQLLPPTLGTHPMPTRLPVVTANGIRGLWRSPSHQAAWWAMTGFPSSMTPKRVRSP